MAIRTLWCGARVLESTTLKMEPDTRDSVILLIERPRADTAGNAVIRDRGNVQDASRDDRFASIGVVAIGDKPSARACFIQVGLSGGLVGELDREAVVSGIGASQRQSTRAPRIKQIYIRPTVCKTQRGRRERSGGVDRGAVSNQHANLAVGALWSGARVLERTAPEMEPDSSKGVVLLIAKPCAETAGNPVIGERGDVDNPPLEDQSSPV